MRVEAALITLVCAKRVVERSEFRAVGRQQHEVITCATAKHKEHYNRIACAFACTKGGTAGRPAPDEYH